MRDTAFFFLRVIECVFVVSPKYVSFSGNQMLQVLSELMDFIIPSLNVAANINFQANLSGPVDKIKLEKIVSSLGLSDQMRKYPEALSGGQQQSVAIARALVTEPKLLLADEPTGNLDEQSAQSVLEQMLTLVSETNTALMVVTHSRNVAAKMDKQLQLIGGRLR